MITDENKKLAQWAMDYALKNGCQAAKVLLYSSSNTSFELRDAKMDRLQQAAEGGLSLSLYVDGRDGSISTNRLNRKELETFIKNQETIERNKKRQQGGKDYENSSYRRSRCTYRNFYQRTFKKI